MKKFFKFLGGFFLLVLIALGIGLYFTQDLTQTADNFFRAIKNNNYSQARQYTSAGFNQVTSIEGLKMAFPYERFKHYQECSFNSNREASADGTGKLKGSIKFDDGSMIPIEIELVKENDNWKIDHINLPKSGIQQQDRAKESLDVKSLVQQTMKQFAAAIQSGDYKNFYRSAAYQFRQSVPLEKLPKAFDQFKSLIDWSLISQTNPVIQSKKIDNRGILKVSGYYPTSPKIAFELEYFKNSGVWELLGIFIKPMQ